jgi:predicted DNA-binding transcriptional regulator YafY
MKNSKNRTNLPAYHEYEGNEKTRRPSWERVTKIHELIKAGKYPNGRTIAEELECSRRTVKRDIQFMKDRQGLPIEFDQKKCGFYYTQTVDNFPSAPLTEAELFSILIAQKAVSQYQGTPFEAPLKMAFQKITGQLDKSEFYALRNLGDALSFRPFAPDDTDLRTFRLLTKALVDKRVLTFNYRKYGEEEVHVRRVEPYELACINNLWYLIGRDLDRKEMRTFLLNRLENPELQKQTFQRLYFNSKKYLEGSLAVFKGDKDYEIIIEFDRKGTDIVRGRRWHHSQEFTELAHGRSRLRMRLTGLQEIVGTVLSWGDHATVIAPKALATMVAKTAEQLVQKYQPTKS